MKYRSFVTPYIPDPVDETLVFIFKKAGQKKNLKKKEFLLVNSTTENFVYVESGLLGRIRQTQLPMKQTHLEIVPPRRIANFINFFSPGVAAISIAALRHSEVFITPFDVIHSIMEKDTEINRKVELLYGTNTETTLRSYGSNFILPCEYRLIILIKSIAKQTGEYYKDGDWILIPYKLTREEYSQIIFASLLTVNNIFTDWKKNGLYKKGHQGYMIHRSLLKKRPMTDYELAKQQFS